MNNQHTLKEPDDFDWYALSDLDRSRVFWFAVYLLIRSRIRKAWRWVWLTWLEVVA